MIYTKVPLGSTQVTKFNLTLQVQDVNASEPSLQQDTGMITCYGTMFSAILFNF